MKKIKIIACYVWAFLAIVNIPASIAFLVMAWMMGICADSMIVGLVGLVGLASSWACLEYAIPSTYDNIVGNRRW